MTATPRPYPRFIVRDPTTDEPLAGGRVWTFEAGSANEPKAAYADAQMTALLMNPVTLQGDGGADIYFDGAYKLRVERADGSLVYEMDYAGASTVGGDGAGALVQEVKTSDYQITIADIGKVLLAERPTAITFTFDPAADLEGGFNVIIKNIGAGTLTLDAAGTELIDGVPVVELTTGYSALVICDGIGLRTFYYNIASADDFSGVLPIGKGGTGQTTGAAMLNGYTGILPITKGGTGGNTATAARAELGAAADSQVVKISGNQVVSGTKNFTGILQANGLRVASVYGGSTQNNTDYPIGTTLFVFQSGNNFPARNAAATIRLVDGYGFGTFGSGAALSGTWRSRGAEERGSGSRVLGVYERVA